MDAHNIEIEEQDYSIIDAVFTTTDKEMFEEADPQLL